MSDQNNETAPYAIIETGSKQYRISVGDKIDVEHLSHELEVPFFFENVLFYCDGANKLIGAPSLNNIKVQAQIVDYAAGPKVIAFKYKRRKKNRKKIGHKQGYDRVQILSIHSA